MRRQSFGGKPRPRGGFTLVELLVVMTILSILAGMLLPVLAKTVQQARSVACQCRLRQLALACLEYANDSGGYIPPNSLYDNTHYWWRWTDFLVAYNYIPPGTYSSTIRPVSRIQIIKYGSSNRAFQQEWRCPNRPYITLYGDIQTDYGMNMSASWSGSGIPVPRIKHQTKMLILGDQDYSYISGTDASTGPRCRHLGGADLVFFDGHVEFWSGVKIARYINGTWGALPLSNADAYFTGEKNVD
ncbi:MAG TPA: hypothetical protein DDX89_00075 [Candidatus Omnitrophica bacterium]|nr:hypothetical protein [Candidatus Omnitrophota bacterium]